MKRLREIQNNLDVLKVLVKREEAELMNLAQSSWDTLLQPKLNNQEYMIYSSHPSNLKVDSTIKFKRPNEWYIDLEETFLPETHSDSDFWNLIREFEKTTGVELNPMMKYDT